MKRYRRALSLLLCLLMLLSLIPAAAFAGEDSGEDFPPEYVQEESDNDNENNEDEGENDPDLGNELGDGDDPDSGSGSEDGDEPKSGDNLVNEEDQLNAIIEINKEKGKTESLELVGIVSEVVPDSQDNNSIEGTIVSDKISNDYEEWREEDEYLFSLSNVVALTSDQDDDYPDKNADMGSYDPERRFYYRQCTDYCAWCLISRNGVVGFSNTYGDDKETPQGNKWGHAFNWEYAASSLGYRVDNTPAVGAIALWRQGEWIEVPNTPNGGWPAGYETGHVAWVKAVNENMITIDEYNNINVGGFDQITISASNPSCYLHIKDIDTEPPIIHVARKQNETSEGFDVVVEAFDNVEVSAIKIGTWHSGISVDDAVWSEASPVNGRAILHVSYSDFYGVTITEYYTNAYAIDAAGNWSEASLCYSFENLGDDFYATILLDSFGGFWENDGNQIEIGEASGYAFDTDPNRIWHFIRQQTGDYAGSYEIICEYNDQCVDINSFGFEEGTSVNLLDRAHNAAQRFYICLDTQKTYPRYYFRAAYCNKVLDVHGSVTEPGGIIWLWTPNYSDAQLFQINDYSDSGLNYPGKTPPPSPSISAIVSNGNAALTWSSPEQSVFDERAYHVVLYSGNNTEGSVIYEVDTAEESHTILLEAGTYTLKVIAKNTKYRNLTADQSYTFSAAAPDSYGEVYDFSATLGYANDFTIKVKVIDPSYVPVIEWNGAPIPDASADYATRNTIGQITTYNEAKGRYEVCVKLFAYQLNHKLTIKLYDGEGNQVPLRAYSKNGDGTIVTSDAHSFVDFTRYQYTMWGKGEKFETLAETMDAYATAVAGIR